MLKDNEFLAAVLADGEWHSRDEIMAESMRARGYAMTVHSRASDLRKRGLTIETRVCRNDLGRVNSFYRLVLEEAAAALGPAASSSIPTPNPGMALPSTPPGTVGVPGVAVGDDAGMLVLFDPVAA